MARRGELAGELTIEEVARVAGVSRQAVHGWIGRGRLRPVPTADGDRIDADDLFRFLAVRRAAAVAGVGMDTLLRWAAGASAGAAEVAAGDDGAGGLVDEGDHAGGRRRLPPQARHERHQALVVGGHPRHAAEHPRRTPGPGPVLDAEASRVRLVGYHRPASPAHAAAAGRPHPIWLGRYAPRVGGTGPNG
jgi:hypothetical protein